MTTFIEKFKEAIVSILPVFVVMLFLLLTMIPINELMIGKFLIGTLLMLLGMPIFLLGIDISITPIGDQTSEVLISSNKLWVILLGGAFFGFIVTIAEPDLHILAGQANAVTSGQFNSTLMIALVSLGIGVMLALGLFKILKNIMLNRFMTVVYLIILILGIFSQQDFLAIAFDASGSTTGSVSVPFLLALSAGISSMTRSNEKEENDGFGILGISSTGAILAVLLQGLWTGTGPISGSLPLSEDVSASALIAVLGSIPQYAKETLAALLPILLIYLFINALWIKLPKRKLQTILIGCIYTYVGLILFLTGVNTGFIETSSQIGYFLAMNAKPWTIVIVGLVFGVITIPAEPSVHVLTRQIEDETAGSIKATTVMITLCIGVAVAVGFSMLRVLIPGLLLWHFLLPGTFLAIVLSYIVPDIFVGIAYDSGGVSAGTMTAAVILPYAQGVAEFIPGANIVQDGFGVIALVAMTPLVAVQVLGLIYKVKTRSTLAEASELDGE